jgi:hypothetical protein
MLCVLKEMAEMELLKGVVENGLAADCLVEDVC